MALNKPRRFEAIPGAKRTLNALRKLGYDFNSAVGDVVDNSVATPSKSIFIDLSCDGRCFSLSIRDDGAGMNLAKLQESLRHGADVEYKKQALGKFGMGLKTASLSQCRRLRVITNNTDRPTNVISGVWDLSHVEKTNSWEVLIYDNKMLAKDSYTRHLQHSKGTIVIWEDMDVLDNQLRSFERKGSADNWVGQVTGELKLYLRMTFGRYIDGSTFNNRKIRFVFNGQKLTPWDPFCSKENKTQCLNHKALEFKPEPKAQPNAKVFIKSYVLPEKDGFSTRQAWEAAKGLLHWNDSQGLYVYRNDRLIHYGGWLRVRSKSEHTKYARVCVDFDDSLDEMFGLTVDKQKIDLPPTVKTFIEEKTISACRIAKTRSEKRRPDSSVNRASNKIAQEVFTHALKKHGIKTSLHYDDRVKVVNLNGHEIYNSNISRFLQDSTVEPGDVSDGRLWELCPFIGNKFKVALNKNHPFYSEVYDSGNPGLIKYIDCIISSIAYAELRIRTKESSVIFTEIRDSISETLRNMACSDGFKRNQKANNKKSR
jgi:hypothetical protein